MRFTLLPCAYSAEGWASKKAKNRLKWVWVIHRGSGYPMENWAKNSRPPIEHSVLQIRIRRCLRVLRQDYNPKEGRSVKVPRLDPLSSFPAFAGLSLSLNGREISLGAVAPSPNATIPSFSTLSKPRQSSAIPTLPLLTIKPPWSSRAGIDEVATEGDVSMISVVIVASLVKNSLSFLSSSSAPLVATR